MKYGKYRSSRKKKSGAGYKKYSGYKKGRSSKFKRKRIVGFPDEYKTKFKNTANFQLQLTNGVYNFSIMNTPGLDNGNSATGGPFLASNWNTVAWDTISSSPYPIGWGQFLGPQVGGTQGASGPQAPYYSYRTDGMKVDIQVLAETTTAPGTSPVYDMSIIELCPYACTSSQNSVMRFQQPTFDTQLCEMRRGKKAVGNQFGGGRQRLSYYLPSSRIIGGPFAKTDANYSGFWNAPPVYPFGFLGAIKTVDPSPFITARIDVTHYVTCFDRNLANMK